MVTDSGIRLTDFNLLLDMLSKEILSALIQKEFPFPPTTGQETVIDKISSFVCEVPKIKENKLFLLKGYAGTGKTTVISAFVRALKKQNITTVLLAPTGRAAKVFSMYAGKKAFTIHKHIFKVKMKEGALQFSRRENKFENTVFIVDEASMIPDSASKNDLFTQRTLLEELIEYVFEGENCKLLFIGDDAQLPPVHADDSPALVPAYLNRNFNLTVEDYQLTDVVRQALDSGILFNANFLRRKIEIQKFHFPLFGKATFSDFNSIDGSTLEELLHDLYSKYEHDEIVIITRSNKRAYIFNQEIRNRILFRENLINSGDYLMAVRNNYYWLDELSEAGFIANGDMMEILSVNKKENIYDFRFADVTVRLCDYPNHPHIDLKIIIDSLESETPSLTPEQSNELYHKVAQDYEHIPNKRVRYLKIKENTHLNAVQVKYGYSLTCHKTQGGQWKMVLIDSLFFKNGQIDKETLRWLYTAVTRATEKVFLINFPAGSFSDEK